MLPFAMNESVRVCIISVCACFVEVGEEGVCVTEVWRGEGDKGCGEY